MSAPYRAVWTTTRDGRAVQIWVSTPIASDEVDIDVSDLVEPAGPMAPVLRTTPELAALQDLLARAGGGAS